MKIIKRVLIIIVILFLLFCLFLGARTIINFRKLKVILDKQNDYIEKDNYYLKTTIKNGEKRKETVAYYRSGTGKLVAENGVYSWTDGEDAYMIDEENKLVYVVNINKNPELLVSYDKFAYLIPGYKESFWNKLKLVGNLFNSIKTENLDEDECYKITIQDKNYIKTVWVTKRNCVPIRTTMEFPSGEILEYNYELKFTYTKFINIEMPDLNDYKILDYETQKVIVDKFVSDETEENSNTVSEDNLQYDNVISDI